MSIRLLDYQVTVPKAVEVSRLQNDQVQKTLTSQHVQAAHTQYKAEEKLRAVQKREKPEHVAIHEKQEDRNREHRNYNQEKQDNDHNSNENSNNARKKTSLFDGNPGSRIDIRL